MVSGNVRWDNSVFDPNIKYVHMDRLLKILSTRDQYCANKSPLKLLTEAAGAGDSFVTMKLTIIFKHQRI